MYITSRGLIGAPRYRLFQARVHDCRARAAILAIPLSKLAAAWRALHHAETQLLRLESPEEIALRSLALRLRLACDPDPVNNSLGTQLAAHAGDAPAERALLIAATEELHRQEDDDFEREYEHQRIALWLSLTGIAAVQLLGLALDHRLSMLLGGLGGFLSPLIGVMRSQRPTSWGVLVLAPVGGALAAPGGLPPPPYGWWCRSPRNQPAADAPAAVTSPAAAPMAPSSLKWRTPLGTLRFQAAL
ncbi:hypothetical protein [Streptomyces goshikiensis]|uniref:hypothetical protein n=1 Tax=Streptomyces goshikiensis TaxID=1942 RepID=UPI0037F260CA